MPRLTKEEIQTMPLTRLKESVQAVILSDGEGYTSDEIEALRRFLEKRMSREEAVKSLVKDLNL